MKKKIHLLPLMLLALWPIRSRWLGMKEANPGPAKLLLLLIVFSLAAYIVFPSDFSQRAQSGVIAPQVHLEGSQPGSASI